MTDFNYSSDRLTIDYDPLCHVLDLEISGNCSTIRLEMNNMDNARDFIKLSQYFRQLGSFLMKCEQARAIGGPTG